jgi:hypothetical protein
MHAKLYLQIPFHGSSLPPGLAKHWLWRKRFSSNLRADIALLCPMFEVDPIYALYIHETFFFRERLAKRYEKKDKKEDSGSEPKGPKSKSRKHAEAAEVETAPSKRTRKTK